MSKVDGKHENKNVVSEFCLQWVFRCFAYCSLMIAGALNSSSASALLNGHLQ